MTERVETQILDEGRGHLVTGRVLGPVLLLHGGAGEEEHIGQELDRVTRVLISIALSRAGLFQTDTDPLDIVTAVVGDLENCGEFSAGHGSMPQADGVFRLTSAVMDGRAQRLSGVIGVPHTVNPSRLARHLQDERYRVLTVPTAESLIDTLGIPRSSPDSDRTRRRVGGATKRRDTVGCVARDGSGSLVAGTSTGGLSFAIPGRVSDAATVAGTYASRFLAVGATGIGEESADDAVAARMETRRRDGMPLAIAARRAMDEALERRRDYGFIAVDAEGYFAVGHTSTTMSFAVVDLGGVIARS